MKVFFKVENVEEEEEVVEQLEEEEEEQHPEEQGGDVEEQVGDDLILEMSAVYAARTDESFDLVRLGKLNGI